MTMKEWHKYFDETPAQRRDLYNVISLEFSNTKLDNQVGLSFFSKINLQPTHCCSNGPYLFLTDVLIFPNFLFLGDGTKNSATNRLDR